MSNILQFPLLPELTQYSDLFKKIEILSGSLKHAPLSKLQTTQIFHQQLLKSSLFSAKIEGNTLHLNSINQNALKNPKEKNKLEIANVFKALNISQKIKKPFEITSLLQIHQIVMKNLSQQNGQLRQESSAIYDQFGNIVYLTSEPSDATQMLSILIKQINLTFHSPWEKQLLKIGCCHYYFEKIHPFLDGNGRTGRVLLQYQLLQNSICQTAFLPIEEYFEKNKSEYYFYLEKNTRQLDAWLEFFLKGMIWALEKLLQDIKNLQINENMNPQTLALLPRRQEILNIIKDHPYISLDRLKRRFPTIPARTISHDVQQLIKAQLVTKYGKTRGVVYTATKLD